MEHEKIISTQRRHSLDDNLCHILLASMSRCCHHHQHRERFRDPVKLVGVYRTKIWRAFAYIVLLNRVKNIFKWFFCSFFHNSGTFFHHRSTLLLLLVVPESTEHRRMLQFIISLVSVLSTSRVVRSKRKWDFHSRLDIFAVKSTDIEICNSAIVC